jgi:hypothetical protein
MIDVDLRVYCNAFAATFDSDRSRGSLNAWGNSFPAEELPFGTTFALGGIRFRLPAKQEGAPDHIEVLGQVIPLPAQSTCGLGLLAFGEMGSQSMELDVEFAHQNIRRFSVVAPAWLIAPGAPPSDSRIVCSHLHYVGGYELASLRPAMWCLRIEWPKAKALRMYLGINPFFHLIAVTGLIEFGDGKAKNGFEHF